jgi:hypothetical protein
MGNTPDGLGKKKGMLHYLNKTAKGVRGGDKDPGKKPKIPAWVVEAYVKPSGHVGFRKYWEKT